MSTVFVPRSKSRLAIFLLVAVTILTIGYFAKLSFEAAKTANEVVENVHERTKTQTETHGNSDQNNCLHKVYEIYIVDTWGVEFTLKFGITSQEDFKTKEGNPRPEYQAKAFQRMKIYQGFIVKYRYLNENIEGRIEAKKLEQIYVNQYYVVYEQMPPEQTRPIPDILRNLSK